VIAAEPLPRSVAAGTSAGPRTAAQWPFVALLVLVATIAGGVSGGVVASLSVPAERPISSATAAPAVATTAPISLTALPDVPGIIASIRPSVVAIDVSATVRVGPRTVTAQGAGTGFVIASNGMIATNAHVVSGAQQITVTLADGSTAAGSVVGTDTTADLAVVHIDRTGLVPLPFGRSADVRVGQMVIVVGNALALEGGPTASLGIVSALDRTIGTTDGTTYSHLIQTDAAMNSGDSGGPLVDAQGRVIGINTAGASSAENVGFAIAIDTAAPVLEQLRTKGG